MFERVAFIGLGLIGSSLARAMRHYGIARSLYATSRNRETRQKIQNLHLVDAVFDSARDCVKGADLIVLATPVTAFPSIMAEIKDSLGKGAIIMDVGSVKKTVIETISPHLPENIHFIPAHPIAGTEHSGPEHGFYELFQNRWCILTPTEKTNHKALQKIYDLWQKCGSKVTKMSPEHHDQVLAITSHLPHLIAYTIVDTATQLESDLQQEVMQYSAGGFRDFTRIAASDPEMWRDIFLTNRDGVMDILKRFKGDLERLESAIEKGDGDTLFNTFTRTRAIRKGVIDAEQA